MRSAIVEEVTNIVVNIIVADPVTPSPFEGYFMIGLGDDQPCVIGWIYDPNTGQFNEP